jgi:autoinducer 2 (AI-2) kinase
MSDGYFLAIDVGTSSACRPVHVDGKPGGLVSESTPPRDPRRPWRRHVRYHGELVTDCRVVREALADGQVSPTALHAVSATSMRGGIVRCDRRCRETWACPNGSNRSAGLGVYQRAACRECPRGGPMTSCLAGRGVVVAAP